MHTLWRIIAGTFRWTWRLLNFVREFILNLFLIVLILIGVGIYFAFRAPRRLKAPVAHCWST